MSNYEKLCKEVGIKPIAYIPQRIIKDGLEYKEITNDFTPEKQLKLIKLLSFKTLKIHREDTSFYMGTKFIPCKEGECYAGCRELTFEEALCGLVLNLIQEKQISIEEVKVML